jgi:signal transduction histidine kinase/HAMP domain-containing protein
MEPVFSILNNFPYINIPRDVLGWVGYAFLSLILLWSIRKWWEPLELNKLWRWGVMLTLVVATLILTLFIGMRFPKTTAYPLPGLPAESPAPLVMFLAGLPWMLAAGLLGPFYAVLLGILSGLLMANWETHTWFTLLEMAFLALMFSVVIRQRYRTRFFRFLRHPLGAGLVLSLGFILVYILTSFFNVSGSLAVRLDYALTKIWYGVLARTIELLTASAVAEFIYLGKFKFWGRTGDLIPSPAESSLQVRFLTGTFSLVLVLFLTLTIGDWVIAGDVARRLVREELSGIAKVAGESLPYFISTGQNLILDLAKDDLFQMTPETRATALGQGLRKVPFFTRLFLFDNQGDLVDSYPRGTLEENNLTDVEDRGKQRAMQGVLVQYHSLPTVTADNAVQVSFIAAIRNQEGKISGVILGRTDFATNMVTAPIIHAFEALKKKEPGSEGLIIDETKRVLYPASLRTYDGYIPDKPDTFDGISPTGTRQYIYYQPVIDQKGVLIMPWAVVLTVPAETTQQLALEIAIPLLIMLIILSLLAFILLRVSLRWVTSSLKVLSHEASMISRGQLENPLQVKGVDEVGLLGRAFEQMRVSLKSRLDELNHLLVVSQGIAANLRVDEAVKPILKAALGDGACMARVVLRSDVSLQSSDFPTIAYDEGAAASQFGYLDGQIYEKMMTQDILSIPNVARLKRLNIPDDQPFPGALFALALRHENEYYGALWVAFEKPKDFQDEFVRFITTLAGQAALAAANARLYATAEIGRQRLDAVLSSTPEPVLVFDNELCLLLLNPAAHQVRDLVASSRPGTPLQQTIGHPDLLELIRSSKDKLSTREIILSSERVFHASVAPVVVGEQTVGKICILRDITHYKQLDTMKSDFVATVSHDLRSPLTLMNGYASMLKMVGFLNEQQTVYSDKIINSVETMSHLVNNLLDLGRIEAGIGLQLEETNLTAIVMQVLVELQPLAHQKKIHIVEDGFTAATIVRAEVDTTLMKQALSNLVENAIKYTPMEGVVKTRFVLRPDTLVFEVQDSGIGIAPLDIPHMFEKFYRSGRREAYQQRGTGLGLAIVKSIIERHGGRVSVDSTLGKGSTFYFEIPYHQVKKYV